MTFLYTPLMDGGMARYKRFTANPGVFAYFVEVEFDNGSRETFRGNVTLIR
jgi:hypothetical protein